MKPTIATTLCKGYPEPMHGVHMSGLIGKQFVTYVGVDPDNDHRIGTGGEYLPPAERLVGSVEFSDGGAG